MTDRDERLTWWWLGRRDGRGKVHLVSCVEGRQQLVARWTADRTRLLTLCGDYGPGVSHEVIPNHDARMDPCSFCFELWAEVVASETYKETDEVGRG